MLAYLIGREVLDTGVVAREYQVNWMTANLTIFNVILFAGREIQQHADRFPAVGTGKVVFQHNVVHGPQRL
jgi:hypothetical protein